MTLYFDFYGVGVAVRFPRTPELASAAAGLKEDFSYFSRPSAHSATTPPQITLTIFRARKILPRLPFAFKTKMCKVYGWGSPRLCDYGGGLKVFSKGHKSGRTGRKFWITGSSAPEAYEAAYIAIHSSVGEALDALGYHRVHALGFERDGQRVLMPLRSGGGKSSIAALMLSDPGFRLLSDEIPLVKNGRVYPFPVRIALAPPVARLLGFELSGARYFKRKIFAEKILIPIPAQKVATAGKLDQLVYANPSPLRKAGLAWSFFWGLGTPQMSEHMLRIDNLPKLAQIAFSRLLETRRLLTGPASRTLRFGKDPIANKTQLEMAIMP